MKKIYIFLYLSVLFLSQPFALAEQKQVRVAVKGLVCSLCGHGLEQKFKDVPQVSNVKVEFGVENPTTKKKENVILFSLEEGKILTQEQIEKIVKDAGYALSNIEGL